MNRIRFAVTCFLIAAISFALVGILQFCHGNISTGVIFSFLSVFDIVLSLYLHRKSKQSK